MFEKIQILFFTCLNYKLKINYQIWTSSIRILPVNNRTTCSLGFYNSRGRMSLSSPTMPGEHRLTRTWTFMAAREVSRTMPIRKWTILRQCQDINRLSRMSNNRIQLLKVVKRRFRCIKVNWGPRHNSVNITRLKRAKTSRITALIWSFSWVTLSLIRMTPARVWKSATKDIKNCTAMS